MAKSTIDIYYTTKTHVPEFFANRDPCSANLKEIMKVCVLQPLPKPTNDNYGVIYCRVVDTDSSNFVFSEEVKIFDMNMMLWLMQEGTQEGLIIILDMEDFSFSHFLKLGVMTVKKFLYYLQVSKLF
ncbi:hypothetical protein ILUMI_22802 [Ignelater luminosus]|uniref:CRAL-TRIO domain-containing protein n=1 Tax=Ignelater luminosus TaxID=2038154 RepID=A0A8K0CFW8_IGNLU|nr:hypothetical protein ILUMI_22802 [Ignelater luminosus]